MLNSYQNTRIAKLSSKRKGFLIALGRQLQTMHQPISHLLFRAKTFFKGVESLMGRGDLFYYCQNPQNGSQFVLFTIQPKISMFKYRTRPEDQSDSGAKFENWGIWKIFLISLSNFNKLPWKDEKRFKHCWQLFSASAGTRWRRGGSRVGKCK